MTIVILQSAPIIGESYEGPPPVNTIAPILSGIFEVGETIICSNGTWNSVIGITYSYQWFLDGIEISGATNSSYTIQLDENNKGLNCLVTALNNEGSTSATTLGRYIGGNWILNDGTWDNTGVWVNAATFTTN